MTKSSHGLSAFRLVRSTIGSAPSYALAAAPLAAMVLFAKWQELVSTGFATAAREIGRPPDSLSFLERLSLLRGEFIVVLLAVPAVVLVMALVTPRRWRALALSVTLPALMFAFYSQVRAYAATGAYLHINMLRSAVLFGIDRPDIVREYVTVGGILKTLCAMTLTVVLALLINKAERGKRPRRAVLVPVTLGAGALACSLVVLASLRSLPKSAADSSMLLGALQALVSTEFVDERVAALTDAQLVARYRAVAGIPVSTVDSTYFGRARGHNLVRIVLETVPASCLDVTGPLDRFPALERLRGRAFVNNQHYATAPNSSLSNHSDLSGWYPPSAARPYISRHMADRLPSLFWPLRGLGYRTAVYEPFEARFELDRDMYRLFGVERHVVGGGSKFGVGLGWKDIARADSAALRVMLDDIASWSAAGTPFSVLFLPQVSHAPWHDPVAGRHTPVLIERCRSLVEMQDKWIGDIVRVLEQHSQLDRTIIAVTGDHGIRTAVEDPALKTSTISEYTFRVPMLLFVPEILTDTRRLAVVTSGIDLAPTLRDLFGIARPRDREQGNVLWDPALASRATFLLGSSYSGVDGYYQQGRFASWNTVTDAVCVSNSVLACEPRHVLSPRSPLGDSVRARLRQFRAVQRVWIDRFAEPAPARRPAEALASLSPPGGCPRTSAPLGIRRRCRLARSEH